MSRETTRLRCAIYTRKSTDEGLDQTFNTLDAQRAACEAYIASQAGEGWECLPERYDDGGWSGGNMDRPALKALIAEIERGRIDIVVVYKVDRLTRSLMDFARIVETFDRNQTSFVSVTQAFNTTNSMGRLTLNVLLSFAQFEREVTAERIRDKIAASRARGMWMGGNIPLGYDLGERMLIPNPEEVKQVRHMFERYLALGSLSALAHELDRDNIRSKRWTSRSGIERGGCRFTLGGIAHILKNRLYIGEAVHKGQSHPGDHEAIISSSLFDAVQERLASNVRAHVTRKTRAATCPLHGRIVDGDGRPMRPTFGHGRGRKIYRYYVSENLLPQGKVAAAGATGGSRVSAAAVEQRLLEQLAPMLPAGASVDDACAAVVLAVYHEYRLHLTLALASLAGGELSNEMVLGRASQIDPQARVEGGHLLLAINAAPIRKGRTVRLSGGRRPGPEEAPALGELVRISHRRLAELDASPLAPRCHAGMRAPAGEWIRQRLAIGLLAPDIQKALLLGTAPATATEARLLAKELPLDWDDQRAFLGFR